MTATSTVPPLADDPEALAVEGQPAPVDLSPEAGAVLLRLAREVVAATASGRLGKADMTSLRPADPPAEVVAPAAAFVTLYRAGELRGCVGSMAFEMPAWANVASAAAGAASRDWRFMPVTGEEVPRLSIHVSVLGPPMPLKDPDNFRPGLDGLIVERHGMRALLLPEVATDEDWDFQEMAEATCLKAGLPPHAWRDAGTSVLVFRTARVSEAGTND